jgi:cytochrome d ubiquinol oxidase subunit II
MRADVWIALTVFALFMYVALDGYDLGIGIMTLGIRDGSQRRQLTAIVATRWDGNESWLILAGIALLGGLPALYSGLLTALYLPVIVMLISLIFRGVAIEMLESRGGVSRWWGAAFGIGSVVAAFTQGVAFTAFARSMPLTPNGRSSAKSWDFLSWYTVLGGVAAVALFVLAGAAWTNATTEGALQRRAQRIGRNGTVGVALLAAATAGLLPVAADQLETSGFRLLVLGWCGAVAAVLLLVTWWSLGRRARWTPTLSIIGAEAAGLIGVLSLRLPHLGRDLTIAQAASPAASVNFLLVGVGLTIPIVLAYSVYSFVVFPRPANPGPAGSPERSPSVVTTGRPLADVRMHRTHRVPPPLPAPARLAAAVLLVGAITGLTSVALNFYAKHGQWIDRLALGLLALAVAGIWLRGSQRNPTTQETADTAPGGGDGPTSVDLRARSAKGPS